MAISSENKLIQVKISNLAYEYLKKYSSLFDVSISRFAEIAINERIVHFGGFEDVKKD